MQVLQILLSGQLSNRHLIEEAYVETSLSIVSGVIILCDVHARICASLFSGSNVITVVRIGPEKIECRSLCIVR